MLKHSVYHRFPCVLLFVNFLQGTQKVRSEAVEAISKKEDKDEDLVFVAGATGKVGSRTVRLLSASNFSLMENYH